MLEQRVYGALRRLPCRIRVREALPPVFGALTYSPYQPIIDNVNYLAGLPVRGVCNGHLR